MPRNALLVEITDEDLAYAQQQDRFNCAIVRAIQRKIPEALRVTADANEIAFTMPDDQLAGEVAKGVRYHCPVPDSVRNNVIKKFDLGQPIEVEDRTFSVQATDARPMMHKKAATKRQINAWQRRNRARAASVSPQVRTYNRFLDFETENEGGE